uniref:Uncharacterized protein n=1 Tax=Anguilla anguilla TaxID=7936 RepID=A0A0E9WXJ2_ANGAN
MKCTALCGRWKFKGGGGWVGVWCTALIQSSEGCFSPRMTLGQMGQNLKLWGEKSKKKKTTTTEKEQQIHISVTNLHGPFLPVKH